MSLSIERERKRVDCNSLPRGWQRDDILRKTGLSAGKVDVYYYSRNVRTDTSLVPPIRQTASIFKQPVTVIRSNRTRDVIHVKNDMQIKQEKSDKPKQLFWEKRLEGLRACDVDGSEFGLLELPKNLKPVGPNVANCTLLQSVATALHLTKQAVTGQTASKSSLVSNTGVYLNPEQPLMHSVNVTEDDIKRQEDRVQLARKKLQDALIKN